MQLKKQKNRWKKKDAGLFLYHFQKYMNMISNAVM